MTQLSDLIAQGERMSSYGTTRQVEEHGPWQDAVFDFLYEALDNPGPAAMIQQIGEPVPAMPLNAGLDGRIANQLEYLREIRGNIASYPMKESWKPS